MKRALWTLGAVLMADLLYLSYFYVWRASYYFPGRYEEAFTATLVALFVGLPVLGAFIAVSVVAWRERQNNGTTEKKEPIQLPETTRGK
jgi:hypothetical protein